MSRRRPALLLGIGLLVLGSWLAALPVLVAAVALILAALEALAFERRVQGRLGVERTGPERRLLEGGELRYEVRPTGWLPPGSYALHETVGSLELPPVRLRRGHWTTVRVEAIPRGRHALGPGRVVADDLLGIGRVEVVPATGPTVLVRPRIPELRRLFAETAGSADGGSRGARRRPVGQEAHGVREYRDGEPLRSVHWASTARRGRLMARELDDPPRDELVVVLDLDEAGLIGPAAAGALDAAVRAAGAIVRRAASLRRPALLVLAGSEPLVHRVTSLGRDWEAALDALAVASASSRGSAAHVLAYGAPGTSARGETMLVTTRADAALLEMTVGGRAALAGIVVVDATTFAGRPPTTSTSPPLLRAAAHGVPVAVVRAGEDAGEGLRRALEGLPDARVAHG